MADQDSDQLRDRVEELEEALTAATDVNRHLAAEVERLSLENDSLTQHLHRLKKRLKPSSAKPAPDPTFTQPPEAASCILAEESEELLLEEVVSAKDWSRLGSLGRAHGWLLDPQQISLGPIAGQGAFGATHQSIWRGAECAVKVINIENNASRVSSAEAFARELSVLALVRHLNVVSLYGAVIQPPERCWLVCEWLPGGTLTEWLHGPSGARRAPGRTTLQRLKMGLDVACGMECLEQHNPPIVHRDLKPSNVMIDAGGRAKVADLGLARILTPQVLMELTPETGSYLYMAPEVVRHELYATQADVWSWACLVSELLTGMKPYSERHLTPIQVALKVADGGLRPAIPATCPPELSELLVAALDPDPMNRPSFAVAVEVMRQVVAEEEKKEKAVVAAAKGVVGAWNRWIKPT